MTHNLKELDEKIYSKILFSKQMMNYVENLPMMKINTNNISNNSDFNISFIANMDILKSVLTIDSMNKLIFTERLIEIIQKYLIYN